MADFDIAFEKLGKLEWGNDPNGGYTNDRLNTYIGQMDPGGETKWGISERSYPNLDIKNLTKEEAKNIYLSDFWNVIKGDKLEQHLAEQLFFFSVNHGQSSAIKMFQESLNKFIVFKIRTDGIMGIITLAALNAVPKRIDDITTDFMQSVANYYKSCHNAKYEKGWLRRLDI
jgi:lysozyme family protein